MQLCFTLNSIKSPIYPYADAYIFSSYISVGVGVYRRLYRIKGLYFFSLFFSLFFSPRLSRPFRVYRPCRQLRGAGVGVFVQKALFISLILQIPVIAFLREKTKSSLKKKNPRGNKYRKNLKFSSEIINLQITYPYAEERPAPPHYGYVYITIVKLFLRENFNILLR